MDDDGSSNTFSVWPSQTWHGVVPVFLLLLMACQTELSLLLVKATFKIREMILRGVVFTLTLNKLSNVASQLQFGVSKKTTDGPLLSFGSGDGGFLGCPYLSCAIYPTVLRLSPGAKHDIDHFYTSRRNGWNCSSKHSVLRVLETNLSVSVHILSCHAKCTTIWYWMSKKTTVIQYFKISCCTFL